MSLVSDDPMWWSFIDWALIYSYFMGAYRASRMVSVTSHSYCFTAGSFTVIIYEWGKRESNFKCDH
jgi:hypothetical protein